MYLFYFRFEIRLLGWRDAFSSSHAVLGPLEMDFLGRAFFHFLLSFPSAILSG
jgi:hypothetical protein